MKFWIATKGIVYNPHQYTSGERKYFSDKTLAMKWLGFVGFRKSPENSWLRHENRIESVDIEEGEPREGETMNAQNEFHAVNREKLGLCPGCGESLQPQIVDSSVGVGEQVRTESSHLHFCEKCLREFTYFLRGSGK